jgi:hypothetical protein
MAAPVDSHWRLSGANLDQLHHHAMPMAYPTSLALDTKLIEGRQRLVFGHLPKLSAFNSIIKSDFDS